MKFKKLLFVVILFLVYSSLFAQNQDPTSIYRKERDKINNLVHTKLKVSFNFDQKELNMRKAVIILFVLALFISCNQQKTVQTYIVEKQDKPGFMSVDLPMSLIELNTDKAPLDVKNAYKSINKVNVLGLPYLNNNEAYEIEKNNLSLILNNSTLYKKLMKMDMMGLKVSIYYNGDASDINEVIVFGYSKKTGVGLARVIGENMNPSEIIKMIEYLKIDSSKLGLQQFKQVLDTI